MGGIYPHHQWEACKEQLGEEEDILVHEPMAPEIPQEELLDVASKFALPKSSGQPLKPKLAATIDFLTNHQLTGPGPY